MSASENTPEQFVWWDRGIGYTIDLARCRSALSERHGADAPDAMEAMAQAIGVSEETVRRFFQGRPPSTAVMLKVLAELKLDFADVAKRWEVPRADITPGADALVHAWRQVVAVRTSAQHFQARLRRTAPDLATLALVEPSFARAVTVMTAVLANFTLVEELFRSLPVPAGLPWADESDAAVADRALN